MGALGASREVDVESIALMLLKLHVKCKAHVKPANGVVADLKCSPVTHGTARGLLMMLMAMNMGLWKNET